MKFFPRAAALALGLLALLATAIPASQAADRSDYTQAKFDAAVN